MQIDLKDKVAVITGAAQGIGKATAMRLASSGANVLVTDIQDELGMAVVSSIKELGGEASYLRVDVTDERQIKEMISSAIQRYGRVDALINNAHFEVAGAATEISSSDWDRSYSVLVRAAFLGAKYVIPHMQRLGKGSIINVSSVLGRHPINNYVTYCSAKAAVVQLSRQLALDYGPYGIRVNTVTPGDITTQPYPNREWVKKLTPLRRTGLPAEVANAICFLVSDEAEFITGANLVIDGGATIPHLSAVIAGAKQLWEQENFR